MRRALVLLPALALSACWVAPPGISAEELRRLERAEQGLVRVHWRADELSREQVQRLLPELASVAQAVSARIGCAPPAAAIVLWVPGGISGAGTGPVHTTHGLLTGGRLVFRYPWVPDDPIEPAQLLGITAHELTEAGVLACVTSLDPYLRWLHDGLAELAEHEVLLARFPARARAALERNLELLAAQRARGVARIDLLAWRQLAPWIVRSQRFLGEGGNLSLEDLPGSRARIRAALERTTTVEERRRGLLELLEVLDHVEVTAARERGSDWASPDDPTVRDLVFYVSAQAVWLHLERQAPGAARRAVEELLRRQRENDHVLSAAEGLELLAVAAAGRAIPLPLGELTLEAVEEVLRQELAQVEADPPG